MNTDPTRTTRTERGFLDGRLAAIGSTQ